jgi:sulfur-carrier protein adenylyltransferase/sulfurtransferase
MEDEILSTRERRRYNKQIMMPEIGIEGQKKLKKAKVLVVGAGGLGCPVLQYLTSAGIGKIAIAEYDKVDESNLQRQVLYGSTDVGKLKSIIAKTSLEHLNSLVEFEIFNLEVNTSNALVLFKNFNVIVDATDNFDARYVINDACVILDKPMVHGSIYKNEGVISVFNYKGGPTYRCYNPKPSGTEFKNPLPSDVGLFGVLPGITGAYMANEVIKIIADTGSILTGKVLLFNLSSNTFNTFNIPNVPENHNIIDLKKNFLRL